MGLKHEHASVPLWSGAPSNNWSGVPSNRERFFIDNLLVRIHLILVMIRCTGLAPWECELSVFPFPGSLISTVLGRQTPGRTFCASVVNTLKDVERCTLERPKWGTLEWQARGFERCRVIIQSTRTATTNLVSHNVSIAWF